MFKTKNDLSEAVRIKSIKLLNERLADCIDLQTQTKWSVSQITSRIRQTFGRGRWTPQKSRQGKDAAMPGLRPALCAFPEDFLQEALDTEGASRAQT